jgi:hypothetical protein
MLRTFELGSRLSIQADRFWQSQSLATVNAELHPTYRMSAPPELLDRPIAEWPAKPDGLKSWILYRGLIPVDRHLFGTIAFPAPTTFVETSSSWLNRVWRHERTVQPMGAGCEVTDKVSFEPRLAFLGPWQKALYIMAFRRRHANLKSLDVEHPA